MNRYGQLAMEHWEQHAPSRVATMTDREGFFTDLGVQVEAQVVELTQGLEGTPVDGESYPQTVGRLTNARMRAEAIVLTELVWIETPELALVEAREEWEATRTPDSWLASWAERIQDAPETEPATEEVEDLAHRWAVTPELLYGLLQAEIPGRFLAENPGVLAEAANIRFLREQT
ncbi:MAG: hypothetical protein KG028_15765 [Actinobacteria bacterium]|jgi:hypothetical protein|nr:hypothetical protein [Actinomycetota bacterium]